MKLDEVVCHYLMHNIEISQQSSNRCYLLHKWLNGFPKKIKIADKQGASAEFDVAKMDMMQ